MIFEKNLKFYWTALVLILGMNAFTQSVPIISYSTNSNGQVQLEVNSTADKYYILKAKHHVDSAYFLAVSMTLGEEGTTIISESLEAYPETHYQILEYSIADPFDTDGDGIDDMTEFNAMPNLNPLNYAGEVTIENGLVGIDDTSTFNFIALKKDYVNFLPYLSGKEYLKFIILEFPDDERRLYFINTNKHNAHVNFADFLGVDPMAHDVLKGQLTFHPTVISANGTLGTYAFNFTNNEGEDFLTIQQTQEVLAVSMPFLTNNLSYYITSNNELQYEEEFELMQNSRVPVLFETDIYAGLNYWGLNQTEGYGYFRKAAGADLPGAKDIVLYDALPNSLPRVAGIITSVIQTPLSHVNLRAIQDNIPNAFIRDPLLIDTIANLLNDYIYFKVEQSSYTIRKASIDEVNDWYDKIRPQSTLYPPLNLDYKKIKPLNQITFEMYDGFGAKCTNLATMHRFGFDEGTIPDGFGIPFYFYQEFMKYNGFFDELDWMLTNHEFMNDRATRDLMLDDFREKIEAATMPAWMLDALSEMHADFPAGSSVRTRSSTNNEDLPGFSGAGLYDSKTQHPDEGHISKSIKQVYASLWNLEAFEEREFFRVDHYRASMGVLCHPNFSDEKVNGVGISADPIYNTKNTFYLNSQFEEALITNPGEEGPEEMLLYRTKTNSENYSIIRYSSLVHGDSVLMSQNHLDQLRAYLTIIHDEFAKLYKAEGNSTFAMDIEYKITSDNRLAIKQARPWVQYVHHNIEIPVELSCETIVFPNPATEYVNVTCRDCNMTTIRVLDLQARLVLQRDVNDATSENIHIAIDHLPAGLYFVSVFVDEELCNATKIIKR